MECVYESGNVKYWCLQVSVELLNIFCRKGGNCVYLSTFCLLNIQFNFKELLLIVHSNFLRGLKIITKTLDQGSGILIVLVSCFQKTKTGSATWTGVTLVHRLH